MLQLENHIKSRVLQWEIFCCWSHWNITLSSFQVFFFSWMQHHLVVLWGVLCSLEAAREICYLVTIKNQISMLVTLKLISRDKNMRMKMACHRKPFHNCLMHHSFHIQCESSYLHLVYIHELVFHMSMSLHQPSFCPQKKLKSHW